MTFLFDLINSKTAVGAEMFLVLFSKQSQELLHHQFSIHPNRLRVGGFLFSHSPNLPLPLSHHQTNYSTTP